jgi:hypothetical protein
MRPLTRILPLLLLVAACGTTGDVFESESVPSGPLTDDFDTLWDVTKHTLEKKGYVLDRDETDHAGRYMETRWRENLAAFRYQGRRDRVLVKFVTVGDDPSGKLGIEVRVHQQRNENLENPLETIEAEWADMEPDSVKAEEILFLVKNFFRDYGRDSYR